MPLSLPPPPPPPLVGSGGKSLEWPPIRSVEPLTHARGPRVGEVFSGLYTTDLADPDLTIGMIQTHGSECGYILEPEKKMQLTIAFECDKDTPDPGVLT